MDKMEVRWLKRHNDTEIELGTGESYRIRVEAGSLIAVEVVLYSEIYPEDGKKSYRSNWVEVGEGLEPIEAELMENILYENFDSDSVSEVEGVLTYTGKNAIKFETSTGYSPCIFIPEYKEMTVKDCERNIVKCSIPITIRNLFTMTAGFNYSFNLPSIKQMIKDTDGKCDNLTFARYLSKEPLDFIPGEKWKYSVCHDVLSAFVEVVSGMKFRDYVKKNIFEPTGVNAVYHDTYDVKEKMCMQYRFVDSALADDIVTMQSSKTSSVGGKIEKL